MAHSVKFIRGGISLRQRESIGNDITCNIHRWYVIWIICEKSEQCQGAISGQAFNFLANQSILCVVWLINIFTWANSSCIKSNKYTVTPYFDTKIEYMSFKNDPDDISLLHVKSLGMDNVQSTYHNVVWAGWSTSSTCMSRTSLVSD